MDSNQNLVFLQDLRHYGEYQDYPEWEDQPENEEPYKIHPYASEKGGIKMSDQDGVILDAVKSILSKVGAQLIKGQIHDISRTPAPAYLHHYFSQLAIVKNDVSYCRQHLKAAANIEDPVERMKHIVTFYVAAHFINPTLIQCRIPLNPIIGETYQREMPTGEKLYMEQLSHRPPITYFSLEDPDGDYKFYGSHQLKAHLNGPTSLAGTKENDYILELKDGTKYNLQDPLMLINNLLSPGNQTTSYINKIYFTDLTNNIQAELHYNPWSDNTYSGTFKRALKWGFGKVKKPKDAPQGAKVRRGDDIFISINQVTESNANAAQSNDKKDKKSKGKEEEKIVLASGEGSWLSHLIFEGKVWWRIEEDIPQWTPRNAEGDDSNKMSDGSIILPSDTDLRPDIAPMIQKDWEEAEKHKLALEKQQRDDAGLREAAKKRRAAQ